MVQPVLNRGICLEADLHRRNRDLTIANHDRFIFGLRSRRGTRVIECKTKTDVRRGHEFQVVEFECANPRKRELGRCAD